MSVTFLWVSPIDKTVIIFQRWGKKPSGGCEVKGEGCLSEQRPMIQPFTKHFSTKYFQMRKYLCMPVDLKLYHVESPESLVRTSIAGPHSQIMWFSMSEWDWEITFLENSLVTWSYWSSNHILRITDLDCEWMRNIRKFQLVI